MTKLVPDAEVAAVLIALAPLDSRIDRYRSRLLTRREFDTDECLDQGWSTGEQVLIQLAGHLWNGRGKVDLAYLATGLDDRCFQACMDAMAARRQADIHTDALAAFDTALQVPA